MLFSLVIFNIDCYSHPLANVKHILIRAAIRRGFFLEAVAVQVQHINFIKSLHQALAHAAEGGVI